MATTNAYLSDAQFQVILKALNVDTMSDDEQQDLLNRATGDVETELCERFVVPLVADNAGAFNTAPVYAQQKVINALRAAIRKNLAEDKNANIVVESTERFINVHEKAFEAHIKILLNPKKHYGFKMQSQADGAIDPVQTIGLARADNETKIVVDRQADW